MLRRMQVYKSVVSHYKVVSWLTHAIKRVLSTVKSRSIRGLSSLEDGGLYDDNFNEV